MDRNRGGEIGPRGRYRDSILRVFLRRLPDELDLPPHLCPVARGYQYADLPPGLLESVPLWLRTGTVPDGEEIRPGRVYRWRDLLVKLYGAGHPVKDRLRPSSALRSAELHRQLLPLRTPRPVFALEVRTLGGLHAALLVSEFVEGRSLLDLWCDDDPQLEEALRVLPSFLAAMDHAHVRHGDLHVQNLIWDGCEWVLLDLDAVRRQRRIGRSVIERQWARMLAGLRGDERLHACFTEYVALAGARLEPERSWRRIRVQAEALWEAARKLGRVHGPMRRS